MKLIKRIILFLVIVLLVVAGIHIKGGYDKYKTALDIKPIETAVTELQSKENYTKYDDIPDVYFDALIAVEDRRFYKHNGFDIIGTSRAIYNDFQAREWIEGGSTISQQLAHKRQEKVSKCMVELEYITEDESKEIIGRKKY